MLSKSLILIFFFIASSIAIDCNGDEEECPQGLPDGMDRLISYVQSINSSRVYKNNEYIACIDDQGYGGGFCDGICVWFQNPNYPGRNTGAFVKTLLPKLKANGCDVCGNIPIAYEKDDPSKGVLTVDITHNTCGCYNELCKPGTQYNFN